MKAKRIMAAAAAVLAAAVFCLNTAAMDTGSDEAPADMAPAEAAADPASVEAVTDAGAAEAYHPSVDLTGEMRYFADPGKNGPAEESFPLYLPAGGSIVLNYWSNYYTETHPENNVSHIRVAAEDGRTVWSRNRIEKGDQVFDLVLDAGSYEITVGSGTEDGRIAFEVFFTPGSAYGSVQGELRAGKLAGDAGGGILSLSGDAVLYLDTDLTVERLEALGGEDRTLTVAGPGTLTIKEDSLRAEKVLLSVTEGTVAAPSLTGFTQTGGTVLLTGGPADSFRIYGGKLQVESAGDGLTGAFEIRGGSVSVSAAGCGISCALYSGAPEISGGTVRVRGEKRAVLVERLREEGQGSSDNLGYRLVREPVPLHITENVAVESPSAGWTRKNGTEYLFPEEIREIVLVSREQDPHSLP